jgi:hypothetical protein
VKATTIASLALIWAVSARAADQIKPLDVKPGLWETKASTELGGMPKMQAAPSLPPEALEKLPPEQRARLEAMMKARSGGAPMTTTTKVCMTREALSNPLAFSRADKSCTPKVISSSSSKQQIHVDCDRDGVKMAGDLTMERLDTEHLRGNMVMKGGEASRPIDVKMSFETKWVSTDCGDVKPPSPK